MIKKKKGFGMAAPEGGAGLVKKTMVCSAEAAAISIGIHVLLILFAGSIVAIRYVQKREAAFTAEKIARPTLERRQLQMPVKVKNLQKKSRRPQVTTRMASVSAASFSLPDMQGLGTVGSGFDRSGGQRSLSSLGSVGSLGFGLSGVNFFGIESKGEKMVFILDASQRMVEDRKGGFNTYGYAKNRINQMVDGMSSATLFNVMVYTRTQTKIFRTKLVPATPENREALKQWIAPLNASPDVVGELDGLPGDYDPKIIYEDTPVGTEAQEWVRAVQASMEMTADNIFILADNWGRHAMDKETVMRIHGIESEEAWMTEQGWPPERLAERARIRAEKQAEAEKALARENEARKKAGEPPKIVEDWWYYMTRELKMKNLPPSPPNMMYTLVKHGFTAEQIIDHLDAVYQFNYVPKKLKKPRVHMVKVIASDGNIHDGSSDEYFLQSMKKIPKAYRGSFDFLRGAKTMQDLIKYNESGS